MNYLGYNSLVGMAFWGGRGSAGILGVTLGSLSELAHVIWSCDTNVRLVPLTQMAVFANYLLAVLFQHLISHDDSLSHIAPSALHQPPTPPLKVPPLYPVPHHSTSPTRKMDPFDSLFHLEETFYKEGYEFGLADGKRAGLIEGRLTGLERGFEKFAQMGRLHGKCVIWARRLPNSRKRRIGSFSPSDQKSSGGGEGEYMVTEEEEEEKGENESKENTNDDAAIEREQNQNSTLPPSSNPKHHLPPTPPPLLLSTNNDRNSPRLTKHILTLYALVEPASLSIQNTEESVSDFDDRLRRAEGKVKIIERITGERGDGPKRKSGEEGIEELGKGVIGSGKVRY